jgi:hypothetical protein
MLIQQLSHFGQVLDFIGLRRQTGAFFRHKSY